jgi:hypothetical protein
VKWCARIEDGLVADMKREQAPAILLADLTDLSFSIWERELIECKHETLFAVAVYNGNAYQYQG